MASLGDAELKKLRMIERRATITLRIEGYMICLKELAQRRRLYRDVVNPKWLLQTKEQSVFRICDRRSSGVKLSSKGSIWLHIRISFPELTAYLGHGINCLERFWNLCCLNVYKGIVCREQFGYSSCFLIESQALILRFLLGLFSRFLIFFNPFFNF